MANSLYHDGRKGMKWGAHVFCGPNCSKHGKNKESFRVRAKAKKQAKIEAKSKKKAEEEKMTVEQKKAQVLKSRSAKELYENAHLFTDAELSTAYNRLNLEKNIKNLIPAEVNKGKQAVDNAANLAKSISDLTNNASNLYNNVAKVYNSVPALNQGRDKLPIIGEKKEEASKPSFTNYKNKKPKDMSDDELSKALKRASTERALQNILDEEKDKN